VYEPGYDDYADPSGVLFGLNRWPATAQLTEQRGAQTRVSTTTTAFDAYGNFTTGTHDAGTPSDGSDDAQTTVLWAADSNDRMHRMCGVRQKTRVSLTAPWVKVEQVTFSYDDALSNCIVDPTISGRGLLTGQHVDAGPVGALASQGLDWVFVRDDRGQVGEVIPPNGASTTRTWNLFGGTAWSTEDGPLGLTTTQEVDGWGRVTKTTDPRGLVSRTQFDAFGRPRKTFTAPDAASAEVVRSIHTYAEADPSVPRRYIETVFSYTFDDAPTSPRGPVETYRYHDALGSVTETSTTHEDGGVRQVWSVHGFHEEPIAQWVQAASGPSGATLSMSTLASKPLDAHRVVGPLSELEETWSVATGARRFTRPAPGQVVEDHAGQYTKSLQSDAKGRLVSVSEGAVATAMTQTGSYAYDPLDRVSQFTDGNGNTYLYGYDGAGRLRDVSRQGASQAAATPWVSYRYTTLGALPKSMLDANDTVLVRWTYDDLGRSTTKEVVSDPASPTGTGLYTWNWSATSPLDLLSTTDPWGTTSYAYESTGAPFGPRGLPTSTTRTWSSDGVSITHQSSYDGQGEPLSVSWPSGAKVETARHGNGKVTSQEVSLGGALIDHFDLSYDPYGQLDLWQNDAQTAEIRIWRDGPTQVTAVDWFVTAPPAMVTGAVSYQHRADGVLTDRGTTSYTLDDLKRVTNGNRAYDTLGNPLQLGAVSYATAANFHFIFNDSSQGYTYDAFGNLETAGSAEFDYDSAQHLVYRYSNDRHVTLGYDVNDALVREAEMGAAAVAKRLSFGGWHQHTDDQGVTVTYEEVLPNLTLSDGVPYLVAREPSGASLSVVALTDGTEASTVRAGVYGQDEGSPSWWELDKLHGGVRSLDDQLVHRGARHHLASDGRWLQPEPLLYLGLTNGDLAEPLGYGPVYARGNSNEWSDRSGFRADRLESVATDPQAAYPARATTSGGKTAATVRHVTGAVGLAIVAPYVVGALAPEVVAVAGANSVTLTRGALFAAEVAEPSGAGLGLGGLGLASKGVGLFANKFPTHVVGSPIQTFTAQQAGRSSFSRKLNYVVTEGGELRLGRISNEVGGGHIDLAGGAAVQAAGEVKIVGGEIRMIDNSSGHYLPSGAGAQAAAETAFQTAGFGTAGTYVEKIWSGSAWVAK